MNEFGTMKKSDVCSALTLLNELCDLVFRLLVDWKNIEPTREVREPTYEGMADWIDANNCNFGIVLACIRDRLDSQSYVSLSFIVQAVKVINDDVAANARRARTRPDARRTVDPYRRSKPSPCIRITSG